MTSIIWSCVPALDDLPLVQDDDLVAVADGAQPVGDDQAGAAPPAQVVVDALLGRGIQGAGRLVQHQDAGGQRQRPGDLQPLALPAAEVLAALLDRAAVTPGPGHDVLVHAGVPGGLDQVGVGHGAVPQRQVVLHAVLEQADVLVHHRQRADQRLPGNRRARPPVEQDLSAPGRLQPGHQPGHRALARPGAAHQGDPAARLQAEAEVLDQRRVERAVPEAEVDDVQAPGQLAAEAGLGHDGARAAGHARIQPGIRAGTGARRRCAPCPPSPPAAFRPG